MKKWSTLIYLVKKFSGQQAELCDDDFRNFLTDSDDESGFSPSAGSIRKIMDFASSYEVLDSNSAGQIEVITN